MSHNKSKELSSTIDVDTLINFLQMVKEKYGNRKVYTVSYSNVFPLANPYVNPFDNNAYICIDVDNRVEEV